MAYIPTITEQLTFDTDDGRIDSSPSIVVSSSGQQFVFYSKFLTTGKESFSRITFTAPSFLIEVEAGSGTINGIFVTWPADTLTATPNSYELVYVTSTGTVGIGSNLNMSFLKDVILLAYVSSGNSSITRIYELEHTGNYIYVRKQELTGSNWVWDDYEIILNTGSEPKCIYDSSSGYIYLTYKKDSASYVRIFNPLDELTWEYLSSINIISNVITLNRNPENTLITSGGSSGYKTDISILDNTFPQGNSDFSFIDNLKYIFLPTMEGDYLPYIKSDITYEIFKRVSGSYVLEDSYVLSNYKSILIEDRFRLWTETTGIKYIGVRLKTSLFQGDYVTNPVNYIPVEIYDQPARITVDTNYDINTKDNMIIPDISSGYESLIIKTAEYEEIKNFRTDTYITSGASSGYKSLFEIINT